MSKRWTMFWIIIFIATAVYIVMLPALSQSIDDPIGLSATPSYRLYIHNMDSRNYYYVRVKNEDTRWSDSVNIEIGSCAKLYRIEPGEYSIRTYKDGKMAGDYATFEVVDENICIEITSVTGEMEFCGKMYCTD